MVQRSALSATILTWQKDTRVLFFTWKSKIGNQFFFLNVQTSTKEQFTAFFSTLLLQLQILLSRRLAVGMEQASRPCSITHCQTTQMQWRHLNDYCATLRASTLAGSLQGDIINAATSTTTRPLLTSCRFGANHVMNLSVSIPGWRTQHYVHRYMLTLTHSVLIPVGYFF